MEDQKDEIVVEDTTLESSPETTPLAETTNGSEPDTNPVVEPKEEIQIPKHRFDEESDKRRAAEDRAVRAEELLKQLGRKEEPKEEEEDIDPETLKLVQRAAKKLGFISKDDAQRMTYEQVTREEEDRFLAEHPEYSDSTKRQALLTELAFYNTNPTNPRDYRKVLDRAHQSISPSVGTATEDKVRAKLHTNRLNSLGSGGGSSKSTTPELTSEQIAVYRATGWSDADLKEHFNV